MSKNESLTGLEQLYILQVRAVALDDFLKDIEKLSWSLKRDDQRGSLQVRDALKILEVVEDQTRLELNLTHVLSAWTQGLIERDQALEARLEALEARIKELG